MARKHIISVTAGTADAIAIFAFVESPGSPASVPESPSILALGGAVTVVVIRTVVVILVGVICRLCVVDMVSVDCKDDDDNDVEFDVDKSEDDLVGIGGNADGDNVMLYPSVGPAKTEVVATAAEHCLSTISRANC